MLIEQNIDFELIGLVLPGRQIVLKLGIFNDKNKNLPRKSSCEELFIAKDIARGNVPCFLKNIAGGNVTYKI